MTETEVNNYEGTELEFVRAVRANNYAHFELTDDLVLITDITDDGSFQPFLSVEDDSYDEGDIEEYLAELDWMDWENVEIDRTEAVNFGFCDVYDAEFIDPATTPREAEE